MKINQFKLNALSMTCVAGFALSQSLSAVTVLTGVGIGGNGTGVPETYGSNLAGTPNIALDWGTGSLTDGWDSYSSWNGRGEVIQTDYSQSNPMTVTFTSSSASEAILISSFVLDEFAGGGDSEVVWSVLNGGTTIVSGIWNDFNTANDAGDAGGRSIVNTGMTNAQATANAGSVITLRLFQNSGAGTFQAMDDLTFDQVTVPEPSSTALLGLGLGAMILRRRK